MSSFRRRVLACLVLVLTALVGCLVAPAEVVAGPAAPTPLPALLPTDLRVGTFNIVSGASPATFDRAVTSLKPSVDVAGLQEIGSTDRHKLLVRSRQWGYWHPPAMQQNPIIWDRSKFDFVSATGAKLASGRQVENVTGAGPAESKIDNWATVVRLVHRATGRQYSFINVHLLTAAVRGGRPAEGRPIAFAMWHEELVNAVRLVKAEEATSDGVFALGDFNVGYEADLRTGLRTLAVKSFGAIGYRSMWAGSPLLSQPYGTHEASLIDHVWHDATPLRTEILRGVTGSDHKPAVATYRVSPKPGYVPRTQSVGFTGGYRPGTGAAGFKDMGSEYFNGQFMQFPLAGSQDVGWFDVTVVPEVGADVAVLGKDFYLDDFTLEPGSGFVGVRVIADGDRSEVPVEHFTLLLVPVGESVPVGPMTVVGHIRDSNRK